MKSFNRVEAENLALIKLQRKDLIMEMPLLLTKDLSYLTKVENEDVLYQTLVNEKNAHFILFLEIACSDSFWVNDHQKFLQKSFSWLTTQFAKGKLPNQYAERLQQIIYLHSKELSKILSKDLEIKIKKQTYEVNSLLFAMGSPIFYEYIRYYCMDQHKTKLVIEDYSDAFFDEIIEFVHTGNVSELWKRDESELLKIIKVASEWKIYKLASLASEIFTKYLTKDSVIQYIKLAQENFISDLKYVCMDFFNNLDIGLELYEKNPEYLGVKFNNFSYTALEIFEELKKNVTHLSFRGTEFERSITDKLISITPKLISLDLAHTTNFSLDFLSLPLNLIEIDLSVCSWLSSIELEFIFKACPQLLFLKLKRNLQMNNKHWEKLNLLKNLEELDLMQCYQIKDEDLILIGSSISNIRRINLEGCSALTDQSFIEFARNVPLLENINLSSTLISDVALSELFFRCPHLKNIKIDRCKGVSENFRKKFNLT